MGKFTTLFFVLSLQLCLTYGVNIQVQQFVNNILGGCAGGICDKSPKGGTAGCVGKKCNATEDCTCKHAVCNRGVCLCPDGFRKTSDGSCEVIEKGIQKCKTDKDCLDEKKECFKGFCVCKECYKFDLDDNCIAVMGSDCRDDEECDNAEHMMCEREKCVCEMGYVKDPKNHVKCKKDEKCTDVSCALKKRDSVCRNSSCVCPESMKDFAGVCAKKGVPLEGVCEFSWQCSETVNNSMCKKDFRCGCMDGYLKSGGQCTHPANCSLGAVCTEDACCEASTKNSYCDCAKDPKVCACKPPSIKFDGVKPPICIFAKGYDKACKHSEECTMTDDKMKCDKGSGKCGCMDGYNHNGFRCVVVGGKGLGKACSAKDVCITPNSECKNQICACEQGYSPVENAKGEVQCLPMSDPGEGCKSTIECQLEDPLSVCDKDPANPKNRICVCSKAKSPAVYSVKGKCYKKEPVLGDACESDAKCQIKFSDSVCFAGHCHCNDKKVETTQCESSTKLKPPCPENKFEKYLTSTKVTIKSKFYGKNAYPPQKTFGYSVVGPINKILKVKFVKMVLAEGTRVEFFMEPRTKIATLKGMTNDHYDGFTFYTSQNHLIIILITGKARAEGFEIEVEAVDRSQADCYHVVPLTAGTTKLKSMSQSPFCHFRMVPPKRSDFIKASMDTLTPTPSYPKPFRMWDSVSDLISREVGMADAGATKYKFIGYPAAMITIIQNEFKSIDPTSLSFSFSGQASHEDYKDARDCGTDIEVNNPVDLAAEVVVAGSTKLCAWQLSPKTDGKHLKLTVESFNSGGHGGMFAVYTGDLSSNVLGILLNQFDYDVSNKNFLSSTEQPGLYILMRASNAPSNVKLDFKVEQMS